jgi:RNA-directed DNA polymerase
MGLELHPEKTAIRHTLKEPKPGFKFLGYWIRNYPVGKSGEAKRKAGYRTYIRPHPDNISRVMREIKKILRSTPYVDTVVSRLQPIITGWSNYYRNVASKSTFSSMDNELAFKLMQWARRKHPKRNQAWIEMRYLFNVEGRKRFGHMGLRRELITLSPFAKTAIVRHNKVKERVSPYDGNWIYWTLRGRDMVDRRVSLQKLVRRQKGKCAWCGLYFFPSDNIEVDHTLAKSQGGTDTSMNLQALHKHCHDAKTSAE